MPPRYACYFVPEPGTSLALRGSALLGRDSGTGAEIPQNLLAGFSRERLHSLTTDARRYGLHATLKAPFFLQEGKSEQELLDAAARFTSGRQGLTLPRLELARIGAFFALIPAREEPGEQDAVARLATLAADAVTFFDPFRAAPTERELARREPHKLSGRQRELLAAWGYPYVFDEFRFHVTLTDAIHDQAEIRSMDEALRACFYSVAAIPTPVSSVCVCKQAHPEAPSGSNTFTLLQRFPLAE